MNKDEKIVEELCVSQDKIEINVIENYSLLQEKIKSEEVEAQVLIEIIKK